MADHVDKQLRDAATTRVTDLTTTSTRVHGRRVDPLQLTALPALTVHVTGDDTTAESIHGPSLQQRNVRLVVTGVAAAAADGETSLDDTLDTMKKEVETALGTALSIGGKNVLLMYRGSNRPEKDDGEKTVATIEIEFDALLLTMSNAPDVLIGGS